MSTEYYSIDQVNSAMIKAIRSYNVFLAEGIALSRPPKYPHQTAFSYYGYNALIDNYNFLITPLSFNGKDYSETSTKKTS